MNEQMKNAEGYYDPTAATAFLNIEREERALRLGYMPWFISAPHIVVTLIKTFKTPADIVLSP